MSTHEERCPHCRAKQAAGDGAAVVVEQEIALPQVPTLIRVHNGDRPPFDCTLHPDGSLTAVMGGEVRRNLMSFADMRERNWAGAHFEVDPSPLPVAPEPVEAVAVVQEALV